MYFVNSDADKIPGTVLLLHYFSICRFSPLTILLTGIDKELRTYPKFRYYSSRNLVHVKPRSVKSWHVKQRASNSRLAKKKKISFYLL